MVEPISDHLRRGLSTVFHVRVPYGAGDVSGGERGPTERASAGQGAKGRRAWYALWRDANGRHQKRLGPAHVRDSGRRTPRGAVVWRAANGSKPDASYLTPAEAEDALQRLLSSAVASR